MLQFWLFNPVVRWNLTIFFIQSPKCAGLVHGANVILFLLQIKTYIDIIIIIIRNKETEHSAVHKEQEYIWEWGPA